LFEDTDERPVSVNTERYIELKKRKFIPALRGGSEEWILLFVSTIEQHPVLNMAF